ncbi:TetR/AcrR family transcriptional regulator [Rhodobacteraceae bacterium D3-12]|nr:TetR/AcrR family transcriptional regulator [Rhodobacteraceae bacterium D3-12]
MRSEAREKRAEEIEAAAYAVLEAKGYAGLSMLAVARAAKASNETLYRWYGDKLGLFEALIARNTEVVEEALERGRDADALLELERLGPVLLGMVLGPRAVALNRAAAADDSGKLGRALGRIGRETVGPWVVGIMARAIAAGQLGGGSSSAGAQDSAQDSAEEMAEVWFALLIGDTQVRRVTGAMDAPDEDWIAARAEAALGRLRRVFAV